MSDMPRLSVCVDVSAVQNVARDLSATAMQNAWRRTVRKTANWIKGQTVKAVSAETGIAQHVLRRRVRFYHRPKDAKVWLGLNPLNAHRLGRVRQTRRGVTAGRQHFPGAWVMKKKGPQGPVFRRVGSGRLPIERVAFDWDAPGEAAFRDVCARAGERLLVIFRQEVNYELMKVIGHAR